jgi:glycosyltransferase involved in cell wall biosynthesis
MNSSATEWQSQVSAGASQVPSEASQVPSEASQAPSKALQTPAVSLLLCTVGRTEPLLRVLQSLKQQTFKDFEVVVVDQNPPGVLDPILSQFTPALRIVHCQAPRGLSRARNVGLAQCRGTFLAFPDDDCWYPEDLVARVVALFAASPDVDIHAGRTLDAEGQASLGLFLDQDAPITKQNIWFAGNSNSLFVRTAAARRINGFDEGLGVGAATKFKSGEETDFVLRLLERGAKGRFHHDLFVHHDQVLDDEAAALRRAAAYAPGFGRVLRLHRYGLAYLGQRLARTLARACLAFVQGDLATARYKLVWAKGTASGYFSKTTE